MPTINVPGNREAYKFGQLHNSVKEFAASVVGYDAVSDVFVMSNNFKPESNCASVTEAVAGNVKAEPAVPTMIGVESSPGV